MDELSSIFKSGRLAQTLIRGNDTSSDSFLRDLTNYDIYKTLAYYFKSSDDTVEGFYFCAKSREDYLELLQENRLDINNFILTFKRDSLTKDLLHESYKSLFPKINFMKNDDFYCQRREEHTDSLKGIIMKVQESFIHLSCREAQSLIPFVLGRTLKEIAQHYNISPRSVETYVRRSEQKIQERTRRELGQALVMDPFNLPILKEFFF